jgi:hypothetical protein
MKKVKVLLTTDTTKRGVFSCIVNEADKDKENIEAEDIRMVVYWSADVKGIIGLAAEGPSKNCKVSPAVKKGLIKGVVGFFELTDEAYKKFEKEPWA